jgi:hypothetical protein
MYVVLENRYFLYPRDLYVPDKNAFQFERTHLLLLMKNTLIVVLFGFLNIKSIKIYAIPYIFSTTLLLYKLDTLLLKQNSLPVLDITEFFFRIRTQVAVCLYLDISRSFKWKESLIFRYFKVFQVSQIFTCGLSDLLLLAVGSLVVFVLRE